MEKQQFKIPNFSSFLRPGLITIRGIRYIVPGWIEVPLDTTLEEVQKHWTQELPLDEPKLPNEYFKIKIPSATSSSIYEVELLNGQWKCNCPGKQFRPFQDCRHIKEAKEKFKKQESIDI